MIGQLPTSLKIGGREWAIRSDYRNILQVIEIFNDPDISQQVKWLIVLYNMFPEAESMDEIERLIKDGFDVQEAAEKISWFIACGKNAKTDSHREPDKPTYDWKQDEQMIFAEVNKVAGREVRELDYLHWWTFLGYFNAIDGESSLSYIMGLRDKINRRKKLDKTEREYLNRHRDKVILRPHLTAEEQRAADERKALIDSVL